MMNFLLQHWFIYTLLITILIGIIAFMNKIFAERKYDQSVSVMILWGMLSISFFFYFVFSDMKLLNFWDTLWVVLWGFGSYFYSIIIMTALRYLPTSLYFTSVRLISSFILLFVGILIFSDKITNSDIFGFTLGVIAMSLLFDREKTTHSDYRKGIFWLGLGVFVLTGTHIVAKMFSNPDTIPVVLFVMTTSAFVISLFSGIKKLHKNKKDIKGIVLLNAFNSVLWVIYFIGVLEVYNLGNLSISYKIQSYSVFIPIILSAIVYKEKIPFKKKIALILVALSLLFFK